MSERAPAPPFVAVEEEDLETQEGVKRLVHGAADAELLTAIALGARRAAEEAEAITALAAHPSAPRSARAIDDWLLVPRIRTLARPPRAVAPAPMRQARLGTIESVLRAMTPRAERGGAIDVVRALRHLELPRGPLDRWLATESEISLEIGPDLGGIDPRFRVLDAHDRVVSLSLRRARLEGTPELDLAADEALDGGFDAPLEDASAELGRDLARVHVLVRELVHGRPGARRDRLEALIVERVLQRLRALPPRVRRAPFREHEPEPVRRTRLFSRFYEGIRYDDEGLYSATPEALALRIAEGLEGRVLDATCGIGAIAIALARGPAIREVVACELVPARLAMARHNARLYGVEERIRFVEGDARALLRAERFDAIVVDPPWGGRDYDRSRMVLSDVPLVGELLALHTGPARLKLPKSFAPEALPDFAFEPLADERGVLKMVLGRRG
ncbi:MAG: methyltransferase [Sandaracinus sp.]